MHLFVKISALWKDSKVGQCTGLKIQQWWFDSTSFHYSFSFFFKGFKLE